MTIGTTRRWSGPWPWRSVDAEVWADLVGFTVSGGVRFVF